MKTFFTSILLAFIPNTPLIAQEVRLIWSEEFSKDGLPDPEKWSYDVGNHGWGQC